MKQGLFLFFAFCVISNAYAEADCLQRPSCEELGYTQTVEECAGRSILPCPFNIADPNTVFCGNIGDTDISCEEKCKKAYPLFAGQANTKAAISQIGNKALAAYAASQFYVGDKNGDFGQGKWYFPSIGEWMYFYGINVNEMTSGKGSTGSTKVNKELIDNSLKILAGKGAVASALTTETNYWTSSERGTNNPWLFNNYRGYTYKNNVYAIRFSLLLKNIFTSTGGTAPKIGDVMYSDKTYGAAATYDGSKTPVGVISSVSKDNRDVTILNLKDLTFSSSNTVGNFNPDNPYGGSSKTTYWCTSDVYTNDITKITNIIDDDLLTYAKASDNCPCHFYSPEASDDTCTGTNKCKDSSGNCITCYSSCSAAGYKDSQPSGQSCSTKSVMIGAGNGATATSKTCYYNCTTIDTCTGSGQCKDSSGNCVTCYKSCSAYDSSYTDNELSGYSCSGKSVWIGSGYGATATSKTCYSCTCTGTNKCKDSSGNCVTCYKSCSTYNSSYKDSEPSGYTCSSTSVMIGSGNGATASSKPCYYNCAKIDTCTGEKQCKDANGNCITCYSSCSVYDSSYTSTDDKKQDGYSCSSTSVMIGSGYGATATSKTCYSCTCGGAGKCLYNGKCVDCYGSCSTYDSSYTDNELSGYSCSGTSVIIGSGYGATASSKTCYSCTCTGSGKCLYNGNCVDCYSSCSAYDSSYTDNELSGHSCSGKSVIIGSGNGATATSKTCYSCTCPLNAAKCAENKQIFNSASCTCENCPNNQTFDEDGKFCRTCEGKQKEGTCAVGENFIEWSKYEDGTACGNCVNCLDESNKYNPCVKEGIYKYTCQGGGRYPIGESKCECGTVTYYTKCGVEETCLEKEYPALKENGGLCNYTKRENSTYITMSGYYPVRYDCTRNTDGKKVYYVARCDTAKDCDGNPGPAYGLKKCDAGTGIGEPFMCGGQKWYESCDPCQEEHSSNNRENGGICYSAYKEGNWKSDVGDPSGYPGTYNVKEKCERLDGKKVYWTANCNATTKDCAGGTAPLPGWSMCSFNVGIGDPVMCGGMKFYKSCETCESFGIKQNTDNGGLCDIYTTEGGTHDNKNGHYRVKEKCTQTTTGKKVYWVAECNVAKDCAGHVPEAAGLKECGLKEFGYGKVVQCGGQIYADTCLAECNYEKTEADCTAEGKSFVVKCVDNKNQSWGECS